MDGSDSDYDGLPVGGYYDVALRHYEESGANALELARERTHLRCICGVHAADEIELRVHRHYDHGELLAAA